MLYVMSREGKLLKIYDLATNPDEQTEKYSVKFVANHGHNDIATGERVVDIEGMPKSLKNAIKILKVSKKKRKELDDAKHVYIWQ